MKGIILHNIDLYLCDSEFKLKFDDRLTLISGNSGSGKSIMFRAFRNKSGEDSRIECFDGIDIKKRDICKEIGQLKNKVIVIDNADSMLSLEQRAEIALDTRNQYIIISHHSEGYCPGRNSLRELMVKNNKASLIPVMG